MSWRATAFKVLDDFVKVLGTWETVGLITFVVTLALIYRYKSDRARDRGFEEALRSKEKTIQRMAEENKIQRRTILAAQGHSNEQIAFLMGEKEKED